MSEKKKRKLIDKLKTRKWNSLFF